ncbi:Nucleotide-diphospho-sugar transferase family protein [Rhynchospora pubera]|uniref:Nucleotide-diphospho-sugar transferase family protein n=1 Tax=Rhynchospora pubera TaxID=906938 RepID=A0AAV8G5J7_9POAL|nr:Nucleotide-diphospho-sugar transferase family protein [Rhynchospora pubera]
MKVISMRNLVCFAVEGAIFIAIVLLYLSANRGGRPLQLFSCAINDEKSVPISDRMANETTVTIFGAANTTEVSLNMLSDTTSVRQNKMGFEDILPLLQKAATDDKTVIITSVNEAWATPNSLLDLFLESFHIGKNIEHLLSHLIIVALDPKAFERCKVLHDHCYQLKLNGVDFATEKVFMSEDYLQLVWEKLNLQQQILELGYNFLFTDVDVLWFQNPFKHITVYADITASCDIFVGNPESLRNSPNTGFFYLKSTDRTVEMLRYWREARNRFPPNHEQYVFNMIKHELVTKVKVKVQFLDTFYFGGFCGHGNDLNKICTIHANCCIHLDNKLHNLRNATAAWKKYISIPVIKDKKRRKKFIWQAPRLCMPLLTRH